MVEGKEDTMKLDVEFKVSNSDHNKFPQITNNRNTEHKSGESNEKKQEDVAANQEENASKDEFPNIFRGGLWKMSRHPNLFFELVFWFGIAIGGLNEYTISFMGFIGPIFLFIIMRYITVPMTEAYMRKTRKNYPDFCKKTNMFIPFFKFCIL